MARQVFLDTSAWLAVLDKDDAHHSRAVEVYRRLLESQTTFVTTILVLAETQVLLRRKGGHEKALQFITTANQSPRIEIVYPNARSEVDAKQILRQFTDQDFSLTDAISFAWMQTAHIKEAFTYDSHFAAAGYTMIVE